MKKIFLSSLVILVLLVGVFIYFTSVGSDLQVNTDTATSKDVDQNLQTYGPLQFLFPEGWNATTTFEGGTGMRLFVLTSPGANYTAASLYMNDAGVVDGFAIDIDGSNGTSEDELLNTTEGYFNYLKKRSKTDGKKFMIGSTATFMTDNSIAGRLEQGPSFKINFLYDWQNMDIEMGASSTENYFLPFVESLKINMETDEFPHDVRVR